MDSSVWAEGKKENWAIDDEEWDKIIYSGLIMKKADDVDGLPNYIIN